MTSVGSNEPAPATPTMDGARKLWGTPVRPPNVHEPVRVVDIAFYDSFKAAEAAVVAGTGIKPMNVGYSVDPIIATSHLREATRTFAVCAIFTNPTRRPFKFAYGELRLSPRTRVLRGFYKQHVPAGGKAAFIWEVQRTSEPTVAHVHVTDIVTAVAGSVTGFQASLSVPARYRMGTDSGMVPVPPFYPRQPNLDLPSPSNQKLSTNLPRRI